MQKNTDTLHTYFMMLLPLLFPECPLSLGSFDCIDCNEFFCTYSDEYYDIIVITIIIAATLWEGADYDLLSPRSITFTASENSIHINKDNNSSSDKDDNPWLDECLLICV